jgi:hypothetical protein
VKDVSIVVREDEFILDVVNATLSQDPYNQR